MAIESEETMKAKEYKNIKDYIVIKKIRNELRSILKDFHYKSETEQMSKDVVQALENLVGDLK